MNYTYSYSASYITTYNWQAVRKNFPFIEQAIVSLSGSFPTLSGRGTGVAHLGLTLKMKGYMHYSHLYTAWLDRHVIYFERLSLKNIQLTRLAVSIGYIIHAIF